MSVYAQSKPLHHLDRVMSLRNGHAPAPVHMQLILSDLCNQDCSFCAYRMSSGLSTELFATPETHNPNRKMPTEKALSLLQEFRRMGGKAVQFTGGGEPTVHKDHLAIFETAQSLGLETALVTNGVKLNPEHPSIARMKWIRVSVDAGTAETYAKVRRVSEKHWHRAWRTIGELAKLPPRLGVGFVVTNENYREAALAAKQAKEAGADNIRFGAVFSQDSHGFYFHSDFEAIEDALLEAEQEQTEFFKVHNLFERRLDDLDRGKRKQPFCGYQYFTTYIGGDMNVYRCCNTAYTRLGLIGSVENAGLEEVWGEKMRKTSAFDARQCQFCQFNGQNDAILAAMRLPDDVNFV